MLVHVPMICGALRHFFGGEYLTLRHEQSRLVLALKLLCACREEAGCVSWKWEASPFHTVPLWMGWPSESLVNQRTCDKTSLLRALTQTLKIFATRKVPTFPLLVTLPCVPELTLHPL